MNWTTETPTEPGLYWFYCYTDEPELYTTCLHGGRLIGTPVDSDDYSQLSNLAGAFWSGPVTPPELPYSEPTRPSEEDMMKGPRPSKPLGDNHLRVWLNTLEERVTKLESQLANHG